MNIGQHVVYFPCLEDEGLYLLNDNSGCQAVVVGRAGKDRYDLMVTDHYGNTHVRENVAFVASGRATDEPDFCTLQAAHALV